VVISLDKGTQEDSFYQKQQQLTWFLKWYDGPGICGLLHLLWKGCHGHCGCDKTIMTEIQIHHQQGQKWMFSYGVKVSHNKVGTIMSNGKDS